MTVYYPKLLLAFIAKGRRMPQQAARVQWQPKVEPNLRGTQAAGCESRTDLAWKLVIDMTRVRTLYLSIWRQRFSSEELPLRRRYVRAVGRPIASTLRWGGILVGEI